MDEMKIRKLTNVAYAISAIAVLLGAFFRLQHYPYGNYLHIFGFVLGILTAIADNFILRKRIKKLEAPNKKNRVSNL